MNAALDVLSTIDEQVRLDNYTDRCVRFMLEGCRLIKLPLSDTVSSALEVAERYWSGAATEAQLEAARVACWQYLDERSWSLNTEEPEACVTRAIICLLYPKWHDAFDDIAFFMEMAHKAGVEWSEQERLLKTIFSDVLGDRRA